MRTDLRALVIHADPALHRSPASRRVADAVATLPGVELRDLYQRYPDFYIDVRRERELVKAAPLLVFVFQLGWYAMPALLKEWFDSVFKPDWAQQQPGRLHGKAAFAALSCAGAEADYRSGGLHARPLDDYLAPLAQTVTACGMDWLAPHVLFGAGAGDDAAPAGALARHAQALRALLAERAGIEPGALPDQRGEHGK